jgi:nitric-oxide synthase
MRKQKIALLWSQSQYLIIKKMREQLPIGGEWLIKELTTPIQTANIKNIQPMISNCDSVCLFIPKDDIHLACQLTKLFLATIKDTEIPLLWVAPIGSKESEEGLLLAKAEQMVKASDQSITIIRYGILFSQLLHHCEEVCERNTLSLPLQERSLWWVAPKDVAKLIINVMKGEVTTSAPLIIGKPYTGNEIAQLMTEQLAINLQADRFAKRRFDAIDVNKDGLLQREELTPYLAELGYSHSETDNILEQADLNKDGEIDFEEFMHEMEHDLDTMLADIPRKIDYLPISDPIFLYKMGQRGMSESAAAQYLFLFKQDVPNISDIENNKIEVLLQRPLTHYSEWVNEYILSFLNVHILPGKGVLSIREGHFSDNAARIIRLVYPSGRVFLGRRTLTNTAVEFYWNDTKPDEIETIHYSDDDAERTLDLNNKRLVGLQVKGTWPGLRWAIPLLFNETQLSDKQLALFRESGQLHCEAEYLTESPEDIICNCTGMTRGAINHLIDSGCHSLHAIGEQTQVTNVCGGCRPLVQEMLGDANWTSVDVSETIPVTKRVRTFRFTSNNMALKPASPGQHIVIQSQIKGKLVQRPYTISSAANETYYREITVQHEPQGLFSSWLFDDKKEGLIRISDPQGGYYVDLLRPEPIVCLGAGIGVTPALAICRSVVQAKTGQIVYVDFSNSDWDQMFYADEFRELATTNPNIHVNLRITPEHGRLDAEAIKQIDILYPQARYYICGPKGYQQATKQHLLMGGISPEYVNVEEFTASVQTEQDKALPAIKWSTLLSSFAMVTLFVSLALFLLPSVNYNNSVQTSTAFAALDTLWRDNVYKQISGFSLLGLSLIVAFLSLRKRIKSLQWGDYTIWRAIHVIVGTLILLGIFIHTGFRLGSGLNFFLMVSFSALLLVGALLTLVIAQEHRLSASMAQQLRKASFWAHILLFWPIPILLGLHIINSYYF